MPDEDHKEIVNGGYKSISKLSPDLREAIAQAIHEAYRHAWGGKLHRQDLSIAKWDRLSDYLKDSNRRQADHIFDKLYRLNFAVHRVTNRKIMPMTFTEDEIEIMAQMEHARWYEERLGDGWRLGKRRNIAKKTSPYLVGWSKLAEEVKERDRQAVRQIPGLLAGVGLEIRRQKGK